MKTTINISRRAGALQVRDALGKFTDEMYTSVNLRVSNISKNYVGKLYEEIIVNSPVLTGAFRRSIKISKGRATNLPFSKEMLGDATPPKIGSLPTDDEKKDSGYNALFSKSQDDSLGGKKHLKRRTYYITATVPYATQVEFTGWKDAAGKVMKDPYMPFKKAVTKVRNSSDRFNWKTSGI